MPTALKKGAKGAEVKKLQEQLNKAGVKPPLKTDGSFGDKTAKALADFQKKNQLKPDGVAGSKTLSALQKGGGGKAGKSPDWPHGDYAIILRETAKTHKDMMADAKKKYDSMGLWKEDAKIQKVRDVYGKNLAQAEKAEKDWRSVAEKIQKLQQSFEQAKTRSPEKLPEILKAADKLMQAAQKHSHAGEALYLQRDDIYGKYVQLSGAMLE